MRTIAEAVSEILALDADSAITAHCIRTLCNNGIVKCIYTGTDIYSHFLKNSDKTAAEKLEQMFE